MMETTTDISRLVSDLEGLSLKPKSESFLPSLQKLYRLGLVLFRILQRKNRKSIDKDSVVAAYRELIESIPDSSLQSLFADLRKASQRLCKNRASAKDLALAVQSIEGLVGAFSDSDSQSCRKTESNSRLCRVVYESAWVSTLSALYDRFIVLEKQQQSQHKNNDTITSTEMESTKESILSCLSRLVLDGMVLAGESTVEESLLDAIRSMEEESTDCLRDLQEWQNRKEPFQRNLEDSIQAIGNHGTDEDENLEKAQQREYIVSMLESARGEPSSMAVPAMRSESKTKSEETPRKPLISSAKETELDRRIGQVLQILPHFGEGFVEVALGLHQGDVESTVATLLNHPMDGSPPISGYPTALRVLDPKLPRRKREFQAYQTAAEEAHSAEEARRDVKERIALEEKQKQDQYEALMVVTASQQQQQEEQQEAANASAAPLPDKKLTRKELRQQKLRQQRKRDEYDDDYDDQYDEIDIKLGAADDGFTSDMTFEQVKLYNQVVQEDESDTAFWESNRNTNQKGSKSNNSGEKKWGPDKIRGGRVVGADGKIVRKPGGVKKKKNNNNNNRNNNSSNGGQNNNNNNNNKSSGGNPKGNSNSSSSNNNNTLANNSGTKKKPKTKPRSDNRVNRQRDRKMKKQGAFGMQD